MVCRIELKVEQEFGKPGEKFTAARNAKCREYAATQLIYRALTSSVWASIPSHPYLTMDLKPKPTSSVRWVKSSYPATCTKALSWCTGVWTAARAAEVLEYYDNLSIYRRGVPCRRSGMR